MISNIHCFDSIEVRGKMCEWTEVSAWSNACCDYLCMTKIKKNSWFLWSHVISICFYQTVIVILLECSTRLIHDSRLKCKYYGMLFIHIARTVFMWSMRSCDLLNVFPGEIFKNLSNIFRQFTMFVLTLRAKNCFAWC